MKLHAALGVVVLLVAVLAGCSTSQPSAGSPEAIVRDFVQARDSGEVVKANSMLTAYAREHWPVSATAPVPGIESLTVSESRPVSMEGVAYDHWKAYAQVRVVTATYRTPDTVDTKNIQSSEPVIVVRESSSSPWRIEIARGSE